MSSRGELRRSPAFTLVSIAGQQSPAPGWFCETTGEMKNLEIQMSILRKTSAIVLMIAMSGAMAHAETKPAAKDIVIVHGALVDASGWRSVYDILSKDGFHVTIVQEPLTGLAADIEATKR